MTASLFEGEMKRRDKFEIMAEIIGIAQQGAPKTRIMFKASLSFNQLNQYLSCLSEYGLPEKNVESGRELYKTTPKGQDFMVRRQQVLNLLNDDACGQRNVLMPLPAQYFDYSNSLDK